ncbi:MAG: hydantoinase/oxoprolinase family protein, partial [Desulfobacula sp.]|nr:hydantoinase/oxoprolinase family protein [Desulfobacula sp.]
KAPVNKMEIEDIAKKMKKAGIEYVGVVSKFCVRNPSHEILIRRILNKYFKKVFLGHHVSGNLNFPRRIATTHLNAAVFSLHKSFFEAVKLSLEQKGLMVPIQILKADGGTMSLESSMAFPGQTVLSGPAASIMGAIPYATEKQDTIVLDIGGTTTDIAFLVDKAPLLEPLGIQRGRYKSLIRSLQTDSKGIGGDSIVRIKENELIIGPERLGPAMAFGGSEPTPTDALFVLGLITDGDQENAQKGIHKIAMELGLTDSETADQIFKKCISIILKKTFEMIDKLNSKPVYTVHEFLEGYKISPRKILVLGGPAPYFAKKIEELYHIKTIAVPESSVANAIGAALARTTCEVSLNADTEQGIVTAHEEGFAEPISKTFSEDDLIETAHTLLKEKAINFGADPDNIGEVEVVEFQKFNIVRNFSPRGKIFRTKMQLKPGMIKGFEKILQ